MDAFGRTRLLLGEEAMERLSAARIAVFGIGGVGGYVVEGLARSGIGELDLIDHDQISTTNINRQIIATENTVGRLKVDVARERVLSINAKCRVHTYPVFYLPETMDTVDFAWFDYVVDAIDTVAGKLMIIEQAKRAGVPVISAMGAGNKLDPTAFRVADIYETSVCPLARVMRHECRKRGIDSLKCVYSTEPPVSACVPVDEDTYRAEAGVRRSLPGSVSFVPSVAGLVIAGEVIKDLIRPKKS